MSDTPCATCGHDKVRHLPPPSWPCASYTGGVLCTCAAYVAPVPPPAGITLVDKTTGVPCPTRGNRLCTITDRDHRHCDAEQFGSPEVARVAEHLSKFAPTPPLLADLAEARATVAREIEARRLALPERIPHGLSGWERSRDDVSWALALARDIARGATPAMEHPDTAKVKAVRALATEYERTGGDTERHLAMQLRIAIGDAP